MTRIVVYGDSHIGAFRDGWEQVRKKFPSCRIDFFGLPHPHVRYIDLLPNGTLAVRHTGGGNAEPTIQMATRIFGRTELDASSADIIIWAGYSWPSVDLARILGGMAVDEVFEAERPGRMSSAAFDACVQALAAAMEPPAHWVTMFGERLVLALRANPSETCLTLPHAPERAPWKRMAAGRADARPAFAALSESVRRAVAGKGIRCLPQPQETLTPNGLTAAKWSRGSRGILQQGKRHNTDDYVHMNAAYGALCLTAILEDASGRLEAAGART